MAPSPASGVTKLRGPNIVSESRFTGPTEFEFLKGLGVRIPRGVSYTEKPFGQFPLTPAEMSNILGVGPKKIGLTPDGTQRITWEPNANTRIRYESHPDGLKSGDPGFNERHHGDHYHIEIKPNGVTWNQANKQGLITKVKPDNYSPGSGTGFLPGENFPGKAK